MKTKLLLLAIALAAMTPAFATTATDGIAASPRLRQALNERAAYLGKAAVDPAKPAVVATKTSCSGLHVTASPRAMATFAHLNNSCCGMSSCVVACAR